MYLFSGLFRDLVGSLEKKNPRGYYFNRYSGIKIPINS